MRKSNTVALYVDKDTVNIYKASLDMYEALKVIRAMIKEDMLIGTFINRIKVLLPKILAKAEGK